MKTAKPDSYSRDLPSGAPRGSPMARTNLHWGHSLGARQGWKTGASRSKRGRAMDRIRHHRDALAIVAALVLPLVVAAILVPFRSSFADTASALVLVAVIVAVASIGSRAA